MYTEFSRQIFEKYINIKFHDNPSIGNRVVPYGETDGWKGKTKLKVAFRNSANKSRSALHNATAPIICIILVNRISSYTKIRIPTPATRSLWLFFMELSKTVRYRTVKYNNIFSLETLMRTFPNSPPHCSDRFLVSFSLPCRPTS